MKVLCGLCVLVITYMATRTICSPVYTTANPNGIRCSNGTDCPTDMCCVHNPLTHPPHNKRFIFEEFNQHDHGYCRYERQFNDSCFPLGHDFKNPSLYEFHCPCVPGLECRGIKVHETEHTIVHENPICQTIE